MQIMKINLFPCSPFSTPLVKENKKEHKKGVSMTVNSPHSARGGEGLHSTVAEASGFPGC